MTYCNWWDRSVFYNLRIVSMWIKQNGCVNFHNFINSVNFRCNKCSPKRHWINFSNKQNKQIKIKMFIIFFIIAFVVIASVLENNSYEGGIPADYEDDDYNN